MVIVDPQAVYLRVLRGSALHSVSPIIPICPVVPRALHGDNCAIV